MAVVDKALALWGLSGADVTLIAARENHVFKVICAQEAYALRVHRRGLRRFGELHSELQWMAALDRGGLAVPKPVPACDGACLQVIDGYQVDVLAWVPGVPIGSTADGLTVADPRAVYWAIGHDMARLHSLSDGWTPPQDFQRWSWDAQGLLGAAPLWGRFWDNPALDPLARDVLCALRAHAWERLEPQVDFGLIHADIVHENVMWDGTGVRFIDFDDSGYGYRLFDVATALLKNINRPDDEDLKEALCTGYRAVRPLDTGQLDLFLALRAASYVGWIVPRMGERGAEHRQRRFIDRVIPLARRCLESQEKRHRG